MRFAKENEDLTGKVAVNGTGRIAVIGGQSEFEFGTAWIGVGFDGKGTWASTRPCITFESVGEMHDALVERFGGKMSYND